MTRIWDRKHQRTETLGTRWVEQVSAVRNLSGAYRDTPLHSANNALHAYTEQRRSLHTLQGAMKRVSCLPARRTNRVPVFQAVHHNRGDEGRVHPSVPSSHSFMVAVEWESGQYRPMSQDRPLRQEGKANPKEEPALTKARRTSAGAPLVSEADMEESQSEVGGIATEYENPGHAIRMFPHKPSHNKGRERKSRWKDASKTGVERTKSYQK